MAIPPITGMLRKRLILDISIALGLGFAGANAFWYVREHRSIPTRLTRALTGTAYTSRLVRTAIPYWRAHAHRHAVRKRETFYLKLEQERAKQAAAEAT